MCGVFGIWRASSTRDDLDSGLRSMQAALFHRGPDASERWICEEHGLGLGHRRLSILDLSPSGAQPMHSASGRYVIVFNGEIYNYRAIRAELESLAPAHWRGGSDTEVMLAAIERWGLLEALSRFVGMFAFALWDRESNALHLVRDRLGVKPLYYAKSPRGVAFGSELKALVGLDDVDTTPSDASIVAFFRHGHIDAPASIYRGIHKQMPGTILSFDSPSTEPRETVYWSAANAMRDGLSAPFLGQEEEAIDLLERALGDAVSLRMISDVPLGAFLSGGVDSSVVVAMMKKASTSTVRTFSIGYDDAAFDESRQAAEIAKHLGTEHTELRVTPKQAQEVVPLLARMFDEPFADSSQIPTHLVAKLARPFVTVALSGDGGDELFGGYNRHVWVPRLWARMRRVPLPLRRAARFGLEALAPATWDATWKTIEPMLSSNLHLRLPSEKILKLASVIDAPSPAAMYETLTTHWDEASWPLHSRRSSAFAELPHAGDLAAQLMLADQIGYLPNDILTKVDRATMAVSLEAREPLLDHRLVELSWRLPTSLKIRDGRGKYILRRVLERHLPAELFERPKMGFGVPVGDWIKQELRDWAEGHLSESSLRNHAVLDSAIVGRLWREHVDGKRDHSHRLWDVLMFREWESHAKVSR